jgi:hypothetical protein
MGYLAGTRAVPGAVDDPAARPVAQDRVMSAGSLVK